MGERTNRYAGHCDSCGTAVAAGAGTWQEGATFCGTARRITVQTGEHRHAAGWLICPVKFDAAQQQFIIDEQARNERYQRQSAAMPQTSTSDETICPKCGGSGLYIWSNGEHDVCYGCDGTGTADKIAGA